MKTMKNTVVAVWGSGFLVAVLMFSLWEVAFCAESGGLSVPTKEQIARLVEAAWKPPVTSIDALVYVSVNRPQFSREELEKTVREVYSAIEKSSGKKSSSEDFERDVAREVERMLREQQTPAVIKKRVRWNGIQYREDKVSTEGNRTVVDSKTEFNRVIVNAGNPLLKDYASFEYDLAQKTASINDKVGSSWKEDTVWDAFGIQPVSMLLKTLTMIPPKPEEIVSGKTDFLPTISSEKVSLLQEDKNEHFLIRTRPDQYKSYSVDRFEVTARQNPERLLMVFYCDAENYSKLYRCESFNPMSGELLLAVERDKFDSEGFPKIWITEEYDSKTSQMKRAEHVFETVLFDVKLPADIFVFNPPSEFSIIDYRPATPIVTQSHEREFSDYTLLEREFTIWQFAAMGIGIITILIAIGNALYQRYKRSLT